MVDSFEHLRKTSERKFIKESFEYINSVEQPKSLKISSNYIPINKVDIEISKVNRAFYFKTKTLNIVPNFGLFHDVGYGLLKPFALKSNEHVLTNPKGAGKLQLHLGNDVTASGELWEIENNLDKKNKKFFRLIVQKPYNPPQDPNILIQSKGYVHEGVLRFRGLTEIIINHNIFNLFEYNNDPLNYLMLDTTTPSHFAEFEKITEILIYTLGFISGIIPGNEIYILQSENKEITSISGFKFKRANDILISGMTIISPMQIDSYLNVHINAAQINELVFSSLLSKALNDPQLFRAIKIISEANIYSLEIRASAYYVALETIKNKIIEENSDRLNPIKNKRVAKQIISELKNHVNDLDDSIFNNKKVVLSKLEQLNQVTNQDGFKKAFEVLGLNLTQYDNDILLKRNDFLHGRIPFEDEEASKKDQELKYLVYKLHFLSSILILKYVGHNGFVKNNLRFASAHSGDEFTEEPFFRLI